MSKKEMIKGDFDSEKAAALLAPLNDLLKVKTNEIVLKIKEDKTTSVRAVNAAAGSNVVTFLDYEDTLFDGFEVPKDYSFGIFDLSEFTGLASIFDSGFNFQFDGQEASFESDGNKFTFFAAQDGVVKEGPEKFKANVEWGAEFEWEPSKFTTLRKAFGAVKHPHVVFTGKKGTKELKVSITEKNMRCSTFSEVIDLDTDIEVDIDVTLNKENVVPVLNSSISKLTVQISNRVVTFSGVSEFYKIKYYLLAAKV